jgi:hypothetical protein
MGPQPPYVGGNGGGWGPTGPATRLVSYFLILLLVVKQDMCVREEVSPSFYMKRAKASIYI